MRKVKVVISTPFPSVAEVAKQLGVSRKERLRIGSLLEKLKITLSSATDRLVVHFIRQLIHSSHPGNVKVTNLVKHIRKCDVCFAKIRLVVKDLKSFL